MEILEQGYHYHIYNRGNNKEKLFLEHADYLHFLKLFRKYIHGITNIYCFCLMPNHFHFLVRILEHQEITSYDQSALPLHQSFSNYFNAYAKYFNIKYGRTGSLFQKSFRKKRVDDERYLKYLIHYIHTNPVHHEVCDDFRQYKYSSYNAILSSRPTILEKKRVIDLFEDTDNYIFTHKQKARVIFIGNLIKGD